MNKAIEIDNITLKYGNRNILKDISFHVDKGHIHGFLGPNGAGKTTTMKVITKLLTQDSGQVKLFGQDVGDLKSTFNSKIGFLLENPPLYNDLTVMEYLDYIAKIKKVPAQKIKDYINDCVESLDLSSVIDRAIENLSKGFQQRVGIAQAIIHKPEIVILDEPTNGLDPQAMLEVRNLILKLKENHTILLSSHLLHEMSLVCDEVTIISQGKILASGNIDELKEKIGHTQEIYLELLEECPQFEKVINEFPKLSKVKKVNSTKYMLVPNTGDEVRHEIVKLVNESEAQLIKIDRKKYTLEDIFISITDRHD
ncbi:MAG: ABC-2 type transport system ATP-binding protein [Bacteriovoracaceae bacterium]|jgi:ABC-2 type transport system ATP-binding protein